MPKYGHTSNTNLSTCHRDLQLIFRTGIRHCPVDFGIHEGNRTDKKQLEYFENGKSRIDPRIPEQRAKGKHLKSPSEALDFHIAEKHIGAGETIKLTWDDIHLSFVAGYMMAISHQLYEQGKIQHVLRWGGDWDSDGVIALDHKLKDFPHMELIKPTF